MLETLKTMPRALLVAAFAVTGSLALGACDVDEGQQPPGQEPGQQPPAQQPPGQQ